MTAANDWAVLRDPKEIPIIEMSYLEGKEDPELITADDYQEQAFKRDAYGYKFRHRYGGNISDYRGAYKSII